jgi:thiamine kinase-like enzyme
MERAERSLAVCASESRRKALFHSDLHHSNLIERADGRLFLLDWEYAAVGDPLFDPACVLAYYPQATPHAQDLLAAAGLANRAAPAMLEHATWLYVLLAFLWDRVRVLTAGIPAPTPAD